MERRVVLIPDICSSGLRLLANNSIIWPPGRGWLENSTDNLVWSLNNLWNVGQNVGKNDMFISTFDNLLNFFSGQRTRHQYNVW